MWVESTDDSQLLPGLSQNSAEIAKPQSGSAILVPSEFVTVAKVVACHREQVKWGLLYRLLYRLSKSELHYQDQADADVRQLGLLESQVRRDIHKMHAFVRFREVEPGQFVAWYEPDHLIVRLAAPFFRERFSTMNWRILTPDECAEWDGARLRFFAGIPKSQAPRQEDDLEHLWTTYYASIFNPARIKLKAMKKEMPKRFWKNLPEAQQMQELLSQAPTRVEEMMARSKALAKADAYPTAEAFIPQTPSGRLTLPQLREASKGCRGCPICELGTQTVFGEGNPKAKLVLIGEQPGDQEDKQGRPFVGPAGQLLDEALSQVGIDRDLLYVTNSVKHFKFEPRGTRRIHAKPSAREIQACKPWLVAELQILKPHMIVALGATAAQAMMGPTFRVTQSQGQVFTHTEWSPWWMATIHPSALLRIPDPDMREKSYAHFLRDLEIAAKQLRKLGK